MPFLEIKLSGGKSYRLSLAEGDTRIGSDTDVDVQLNDPLVAPLQALISCRGNQCAVRNLAEDHPLHLNGAPLETETVLSDGDRLILGSTRCLFLAAEPEATQELLEMSHYQSTMQIPVSERTQAVGAPPAPPPAPPTFDPRDLERYAYLEITTGETSGGFFPLRQAEILVGQAADVSLRLAGTDISPRHAKIIQRPEGYWIVDMESASGLYLNGHRVMREALSDGDTIRIGHTTLVFHPPRPPAPTSTTAAPEPPPATVAAPRSVPLYRRWYVIGSAVAVIVAIMAVAGFLAYRTWHREAPPPDPAAIRAGIESFIQAREWKQARIALAADDAARLPAETRERLHQQIEMESEAAGYAADARTALDQGTIESALQFYFLIPTRSVYRPEIARRILQHLEASIGDILNRQALAAADYSQIAALGEKMLQVKPDDAAALSYICLARLGQNQFTGVLETAGRLLSAHPDSAEGHYFRALAHYYMGDPRTAFTEIDEALRLAPNTTDFILLRAKLDILLNRLADARLDLDRVLKQDPNHEMARALYRQLTGQAPSAAPTSDTRQAREYRAMLRRRRQAARQERDVQAAVAAFQTGHVDQAATILGKLGRDFPNSGHNREWHQLVNRMQQVQALHDAGLAAEKAGHIAEALEKWQEMKTLEREITGNGSSPFTIDVAPRATRFLADRAEQDLRQGQLDRAYILATRALEWDPANGRAAGIQHQIDGTAEKYYREGFRMYQHGNMPAAREYWEKVCKTVSPRSDWFRKAREKLSETEAPQ